MEYEMFEKLRKAVNESEKVPELEEAVKVNALYKELVLACFKTFRVKNMETLKFDYAFKIIGEVLYSSCKEEIENYIANNTTDNSFEVSLILNKALSEHGKDNFITGDE